MLHSHSLENYCRLCGEPYPRGYKNKKSKTDIQELVRDCYGIDVSNEDRDVYPEYVCLKCVAQMRRIEAAEGKKYINTTVSLFNWQAHDCEDNCEICDHFAKCKKGGRPKKCRKNRGRVAGETTSCTVTSVQAVASERLVAVPVDPSRISVSQVNPDSHLLCQLCQLVVNGPVQLKCEALACGECLVRLLHSKGPDACCPACGDQITSVHLQRCPSVVVELLCNLRIKCAKGCHHCFPLQYLSTHEECCIPSVIPPTSRSTMSETTFGEVLGSPVDAPLSPDEQRVCTHLVKRALHESGNPSTLILKTGGQSLAFHRSPIPRVSSTEASNRTLKRRRDNLKDQRTSISGGNEDAQKLLQAEVRAIPTKERQELLSEAGIGVEMNATQALAIKADLAMPWYRIRVLRRWLKSWNITMASESKQRSLAKELTGGVTGEYALFSFLETKKRVEVFRRAAFVWVEDLEKKIVEMLEHSERERRLTWHSGLIPSNEIWVKIGADKGGGSMKTSFQICNVPHPNSCKNSCVFSIYEAPDTTTNLNIALGPFKAQINSLCGKVVWREKKARVFLCGDYAFLCIAYGLSGASGRHCCLWCEITSSQLIHPRTVRGRCKERSLESLKTDYAAFVAAGGKLEKAKEFNNVIAPYFFEVPLTQVTPPGLHISLGIFYRLFTLLETECHKLDLQLATELSTEELAGGPSFEDHVSMIQERQHLMEHLESLETKIQDLNSLATWFSVQINDAETNPQLAKLLEATDNLRDEWDAIDKQISDLNKKIRKGFACQDGVFVKALDTTLASFNVERQAYYGGTFIGNHVHRCLKPENTKKLCSAVVEVAQKHNQFSLLPTAQSIDNKFQKLFNLFGACHKVYDSADILENSAIDTLETNVDKFLSYYRELFPDATITPKMHMLEDHVVPFLRKWQVGFGLHGEQGAESLHAAFNRIMRSYTSIPDRLTRLKSVMKEHHLQVAPTMVAQEPTIKRRKKN